jgi:hypothetical protein
LIDVEAALRALTVLLLSIPIVSSASASAQSPCGEVRLQLAPDYSFAIGSSSGGGHYSFTLRGKTLFQGLTPQLALFHYNKSLDSTSGIAPSESAGTSFLPGKFGSAVTIAAGGSLNYPQAGHLSLENGTVEMWVAPRYDGSNSVYMSSYQVLFLYDFGGDQGNLALAIATDNGTSQPYFYVGAANNYAGYAAVSGISAWKAGQWHHLAFTYSSSHGRLRIYVDGVLAAETDARIQFPLGPKTFSIGGDGGGNASNFAVDEVRISNGEMSAAQIAFDAARSTPFADNESFLPLDGVAPGELTYAVSDCGSATYNFTGVPINDLTPPAGLLPAGSTSVTMAFKTLQPTDCRYSVGSAANFASMRPLGSEAAAATHKGVVEGISSNPLVTNKVYLRCASNPDYLLSETYRVVALPGRSFPRIGNIWIGQYVLENAPENALKTQLVLGADGLSAAQVTQLRTSNPHFLNIPAVNVTDTSFSSLPESYYLHDTHRNRIQDWPDLYVLNVTRPAVVQYLAQYAHRLLVSSNFVSDGLFFDSFNTSIPQPFTDYLGNVVEISSKDDGVADEPAALNAAWSAGEYGVVSAFRSLAPGAYVSGHVLDSPADPRSLDAFNGTSLEFYTQSVREGQSAFSDLWNLYQAWESQAVSPTITMIQACPPNQLSYGYGYHPLNALLPSTVEFAQSFYPNMRFGLGLSLMGNGFFGFDFGDEGPPITWWYDEYDFNLGTPTGPAKLLGTFKSLNLLTNGGFESGLSDWELNVFNDGKGKATVAADPTDPAPGSKDSAHISVTHAATVDWHIDLEQDNLPLSAGVEYQVQFWARAGSPRVITVSAQGGAPDYPYYGLSAQIAIGTSWKLYSASFQALATAHDGRLEFWVGDAAGNVWLDGVQLSLAPPQVYRRDFTNGAVLLNGMSTPQTVTLGAGFKRYSGTQAPLYQYIVDDSDSAFSSTGSWKSVIYDTGAYSSAGSSANLPPEPQNQNGPFYHCWKGSCHKLNTGSGQAQWKLNIPADGRYTIQIWLPAAPGAASWTKDAIYELVAGGKVVATAAIDQTSAAAGDAWHMVATANLQSGDSPFLRVRNGGSGALIADAVYVTSAALYNDGEAAPKVTLGAFDAILLERIK